MKQQLVASAGTNSTQNSAAVWHRTSAVFGDTQTRMARSGRGNRNGVHNGGGRKVSKKQILTNNPLFNALEGRKHVTANAASDKLLNNQLAMRLGEVPKRNSKPVRGEDARDIRRHTVRDTKEPNQLAVALGLVKTNRRQSNRNINNRDNSIPYGRGSGRDRDRDRDRNGSIRRNDPPNLRPRRIVGKERESPNFRPNTVQSRAVIKSKSINSSIAGNNENSILTFRNASLIPFLRIENLIDGASESDILMVLSKLFGPILKILKMRCSRNNRYSVTAEVFLFRDDGLEEKAKKLDGIIADERKLKVTVDYHSKIINSDKLWEEELKDVRLAKQQLMKRLKVSQN